MLGKRGKVAGARFFADWEREVVRLERELREGSYRPGAYHYFHITDPKLRIVAAAPFRDRVVHHALVRVIEPLFEPRFIEDSYACRRGKGTHAGMRRALEFAKRFPWAIKCDIRRYFPSIDHTILRGQIGRVIGDPVALRLTAEQTPAAGSYTLVTASGGVVGTPGTVELPDGLTATVSVVDNSLVLAVEESDQLSAFDQWAAASGLDAGADLMDDPDGDGVANILEWILGGDPLDGRSAGLVAATVTSDGGLSFTFSRKSDAQGIASLTFEHASSLDSGWVSVAIGAASSGPDADGVTVAITPGSPDQVTVTVPASNAVSGKLFGRLKATAISQ